jgi:hypothetical protein
MSNIKGYRELSEDEIAIINKIKGVAESIGQIVDTIDSTEDADKRWVAIARTDLQTGFMALIRSIAQPTTF